MRVLNRALFIFTSVVPLITFCFCEAENAFYVAISIAVHECAHLAALKIFKGRILSFRIAPFGLCIDYDAESLSLLRELAVCAAGCVSNLLLTLISLLIYAAFGVDTAVMLALVSAVLGMMNLLPIYPLDGYRVLNIIFSFFVLPAAAFRISFFISGVLAFLFFGVAAYLFTTALTGVLPLLFSLYIFSVHSKFAS
ncbi:MAG: hypothetical protein IKU61_05830 [Clostridia bacterium]|nr:hypothetical protein [Clostridia bacterium]